MIFSEISVELFHLQTQCQILIIMVYVIIIFLLIIILFFLFIIVVNNKQTVVAVAVLINDALEELFEALRRSRVEMRVRIGLGEFLEAQPAKIAVTLGARHFVATIELLQPALAIWTLFRGGRDCLHASSLFERSLYALLAILFLQLSSCLRIPALICLTYLF